MTQASSLPITMSPDFNRAKMLSRVMSVLFDIAFWLMLLVSILCLTIPFVPLVSHGHVAAGFENIRVSLDGLSTGQLIWVLLAMEMTILPIVFLNHHTRRVFGHFAKGQVFVLPVISHIRRAGLWLIISFFANIAGQTMLRATGQMQPGMAQGSTWPLVIGAVTFIAAYVMEEARRIAADHAEIV